ncbi:MAG TPA: NADP-dependent oxidoreductase [Mycobacteriales bacterium]|nr:NADP-dependent oxidoreductase [Mycobacteriales bacterium]
MRALHVPGIGEHERLSDVPVPAVLPGTVLVRVHAAALNAVDNVIAVGMLTSRWPRAYPVILGRDAAGVVAAVGPGVRGIAVGDEVFGSVPLTPPIQAGTLAEYALMPADSVAAKPAGMDFVTAAAIPFAGTVATAAVAAVDLRAGETVLVTGASGGVGSFAVQLAAARGATVIATGAADSTERLRRLGAAIVVDHTAGPVAAQVRAVRPEGVDALIDLVAYTAGTLPLDAVAPGGRVACTGGANDELTMTWHGLIGREIVPDTSGALIGRLADQVAAGALSVDVTEVLSLDQATDGLRTIAQGHARGKIVISLAG